MDINLISAMFKSQELEQNYRKHYLNQDKNKTAIIIRFLAFTILLFAYFDYHLFGITRNFFYMFTIRFSLVLVSMLSVSYITDIQACTKLEHIILFYSVSFMFLMTLIMRFNPYYYLQYPVIPALILFALYGFPPNQLKLQLIPPVLFTIGYIAAIIFYNVFEDKLGLIVSIVVCIICNISGLYSIRRTHIYRRKQFSLLENEKVINNQLKKANEKIKQLSGLLPICCNCKKIRNDKGYWEQIESFIETNSNAQFSHSLCSECSKELYKNEPWYKKKE